MYELYIFANYIVIDCAFQLNGGHNCGGSHAYLRAYDQNGNVLSSVNHHSATFSNLSHGRSYSIKFLESNGSASVEKTIHFTVS